jgi:hypothetical protein
MEEGGGFEVERVIEVDKGIWGWAWAGMELWSSPDRSLFLSFSSFSDSSDFFQRGPKARLSLLGPVLWAWPILPVVMPVTDWSGRWNLRDLEMEGTNGEGGRTGWGTGVRWFAIWSAVDLPVPDEDNEAVESASIWSSQVLKH